MHWARGGKDDGKQMDKDAKLLGVNMPEQEKEDVRFPVDPENWDVVEAFMRCSTQWIYSPMGGRIGMNYPGVESVLNIAYKKKQRRKLFLAIQIMESAVLSPPDPED